MLAQDYGSQLEILPIADEYSVGIESMRYSHLVRDPNKHTFFERKIAVSFLSISLNIFWAAQKNRLTDTVLPSAHNFCFGLEIKIIFYLRALIWRPVRVFLQTLKKTKRCQHDYKK